MLKIGAAARPGMDRNAGRLIDDQNEPVAIEHALGQPGGEPGAKASVWVWRNRVHMPQFD